MKRIFIYIFAATSFFYSSCSGDWLNLNPSTSVTSEQAIRTLEEAQIALNGIYRIAASHSYYGDNYLYYADCRGEDVQARISKGPGKRVSPYYEFNVTADDALNITRCLLYTSTFILGCPTTCISLFFPIKKCPLIPFASK